MKYCNTCETEKEKIHFGKRAASKDGLSAMCKMCQKYYDRSRRNDKHRKEARAVYAQTKEGKLAGAKAKAKWRNDNPKKYKAHNKINSAIRSGNIKKLPCELCGSDEKMHAHHDDYEYPLSIRWLCSSCHSQWHRDNGEGKNAV